MFPVYIRNTQSGSLLTAKETDVEFNSPSEQRSEYQHWNIDYVSGLGGRIFKIISKKNGKALQMSGIDVKIADCDNRNVEQQWKKNECFLLPQEQCLEDCRKIKIMSAEKNGSRISLQIESSPLSHKPEQCFEIQHIAADSYF